MQKIICNKLYDTEKATLIKKSTFGFFGSADGYEESLYQTENGLFFLYVNGGEKSKYPKENIARISAQKAKIWLTERHETP